MKTLVQFLSLSILHAATTMDISPTATQALIRVHTDQDGNCTFRASEGASIGTLVNDVDTSKFPGSNSDARPGSVVGPEHIFVLGTRTAAKATDGKWYSRTLQAFTQHTVESTCGADVTTKTFSTVNPPLGNMAGEVMPFDSTAPYNAALPTIDMSMANGLDTGQATKYIDPLTGLLAVRITGPMQGSSIFKISPGTPPAAFDTAAAWTSPLNSVGSSGFAVIGTAGAANALFIPFGIPELLNYQPFGEWGPLNQIDDLNVSINASGASATAADRVMLACISLHHGAACDTDTITIGNIPQSTPGVVTFPNTASATGFNPFWKLWTTASPYPAPVDLGTRTGTATSATHTITWVSGALFSNRLIGGDRINLIGSGCSNGGSDYCTVASVTDSKHIVIAETVNVASPAAFKIQNAGLRIWKNTGAGTVSINTVRWYAGVGLGYSVTANEQKDLCSPNTFSLAANRDGSVRSPAVPARLCEFQAGNSQNAAYVWVPSTGEAWHIMNGATPYTGSGLDDTNAGAKCGEDGPVWHPADPFSYYCGGGTQSGFSVVFHFTYNYVAGAGSCNGREWNDTTYGTVADNPCSSYVIDTLPSANRDVVKLFKALDASFDGAYFNNITSVGGIGSKYLAYSFSANSQGSMAYFGWYDVVAKNFVKSGDTFRTWPTRWAGSHGLLLVHNLDSSWSMASVNDLGSYQSGQKGNDANEMAIVSITGRGDNTLPSNYFTACPVGLDARWVARGAVGNKCVQITVDGHPRLENPSAADQSKWSVSALNGAWRQIQTIAEGDQFRDKNDPSGTLGERFLVVKITPGSGNQLILDLMRGPLYPGIGPGSIFSCGNITTHTATWVPLMTGTDTCLAGNLFWYNITGSGTSIAENFQVAAGHIDTTGIGPNGGIISDGIPYQVQFGSMPGNAANPVDLTIPQPVAFNGSIPSNIFVLESHQSSRQVKAPLSEQGWVINGHPYGGAIGGATTICTMTSVTLLGGTTQVYKVVLGNSCPTNLDAKNYPFGVTVGRFLLQDKSSAATGNQITDSDSYKFCYAYASGECRAGSTAGDFFVSAPFIETSGVCSFALLDVSTPCVFATYAMSANLFQVGLAQLDPIGGFSRRLGHGFTVPTHPSNYWSGTSDPDGQWAFFSPVFADNMVVNQYFAYKLPPTPQRDSVARNGYVSVPVTINNAVAGDTIRVRFGYAEFGPVDGSANSLYCTSRAETCYTTGSPTSTNPFVFASEAQSYIACNPSCTVNVPALANHVIYYTFDRKNGSDVSNSQLHAVAVP